MATHDYVIANQSGAAFRTDLNNALAAIVSNNSNSSSPATTYAYQWWADTTSGTLKIRNSANNAWIELLQLDGTLTLEDGSASTPALAFRDDLNTGIFSSGNDNLDIAASGSTVANFTSSGLSVTGAITSSGNITLADKLVHSGDTNTVVRFPTNDTVSIETAGNESFRVDSSRRILVNTTSQRIIAGGSARLQIENTSTEQLSLCRNSNDNGGPSLAFGKTRSGATVQDDDSLGSINWAGDDGTDVSEVGAKIEAKCDAATGGNKIPSRMEFYTENANSALNLNMVITRNGQVFFPFGDTRDNMQSYCHSTADEFALGKPSATADTGMTIVSNPSFSSFINFSDGSSGTRQGSIVYQHGSGTDAMFLRTNNNQNALAINSSQQVLIGTTSNNSANHTLIVSGDGTPSYFANGAGLLVQVTNSNDTHCAEFFQGRFNKRCITHSHSNTGSVTFDTFEQADVSIGSIGGNGSNVVYNTSSDYRLKENIVNITDGITRLKQLIPRRFNWISDSTNTLEDGFIAHEISPVIPEAVTGEKDAVEEDGSIDPQQMDYGKVTPLLTAALQEAIAKIEVLETKVAALEAA